MKKLFVFIMLVFFQSYFAQDLEQSSSKQSSFALLQPITVTIGGDFILTGSFTSSRNQRLDHFVTSVFAKAQENVMRGLNKPETIKLVMKEFDRYALRDITMKRVNGDILKIDLLKFRLNGDFSNNPYLMQDDVIIFPASDYERNFVDISGAVNKPIKFQFVEGDKLSDAITFAGGINPAFENVTEVEISRITENGNNEEIVKTSISKNPLLIRGDRVTVLYNDNFKKPYKVLVLGEVGRPGYVYITKGSTTLRQVIIKAGGFTKQADLKRTELVRGTDNTQTLKLKAIRNHYEKDSTGTTLPVLQVRIEELLTEENRLSRTSNLTAEEFQTSLAPDLYLKMNDPKDLIDFSEIFSDSSYAGNTIVYEGDIIVVPTYMNSIYVFGQVKNPGYVKYESGKDWKYYLEKAGGYTERAKDESEVRVIKGDSKTWLEVEDKYLLESGDMIYVPKTLPRDFAYYIQQIGSISSIVSTIVTLTFIIIQSTK
ncbi:MAG: Periplasmic polysaccharide export protein [Ignavibacteria bacterium]|nr:MAG: Periplasmic polysaccharide export protein [Ignavibacteria bacterium]KAF0161237.1 MAG: Periplasmic polysaccharide export protein [Ignavibacteria bacterium]